MDMAMPGAWVASRITHDRHLGLFIGARPEPAQAVKDKLMDKLHDRGRIMPQQTASKLQGARTFDV